jgi:hypothetical protein
MLKLLAAIPVVVTFSGPLPATLDSSACNVAIGAIFKGITTVPRKVTITDAQGESKQTIYVDGKVYVYDDGKWKVSNYDTQREIWFAEEALKFAHPDCQYIGTEQLHKTQTTTYTITTYEDSHKIHHKIWIGANGLPLRIDSDDDLGDHNVYSRQEFEFKNVEVPK